MCGLQCIVWSSWRRDRSASSVVSRSLSLLSSPFYFSSLHDTATTRRVRYSNIPLSPGQLTTKLVRASVVSSLREFVLKPSTHAFITQRSVTYEIKANPIYHANDRSLSPYREVGQRMINWLSAWRQITFGESLIIIIIIINVNLYSALSF